MVLKSGTYKITATPITMFAHLLVIAVTTLVLVWLLHFEGGLSFDSPNQAGILNVHILLMVVGFVLVLGEAIMAYKTIPAKRQVRKGFHAILHFVALVAGIIGVYAAFKSKSLTPFKHMTSLHSWLGITAIGLFGLQYILGFFSYIFPKSQMSARALYLPWHVFGGMVIFFLALCTAELGLLQMSNIVLLAPKDYMVNFTGVLLIVFGIGVGLSVILPRG